MLGSLHLSRLGHHNVCMSCLSCICRRSDFIQSHIRHNSTTTLADAGSNIQPNGDNSKARSIARAVEDQKKTGKATASEMVARSSDKKMPDKIDGVTVRRFMQVLEQKDQGSINKTIPEIQGDTTSTDERASIISTNAKEKSKPLVTHSISRKAPKTKAARKGVNRVIRRLVGSTAKMPETAMKGASIENALDKMARKPMLGLTELKGINNSTRDALINVLRNEKLSIEDKKVVMARLRDVVIANPSKVSDIPKDSDKRERPSVAMRRVPPSSPRKEGEFLGGIKKKAGMTAYEIQTVEAAHLELVPLEIPRPPVPSLAYGLERVLFNPGVYHLRDPRSRVFNFDPYLQSIMPVEEFDFNALKEYVTSSRDENLIATAAAEHKKYTGSTSSMTSALAHFHFLLSQWRPVNISNLSQGFPETLRSFTSLQRAPSAVFLRWRNGTYAIDADKEFDTANILMMLGKSMEKLLTLPTQDFEKYRKENSSQISEEERNEAESFHFTTMGDFLMRSQLDAHDPRIPGTGMFDLKTRAVVSIRMNAQKHHGGLGYEIRSRHGEFESYEREYYDMIRAAFLKYSLQVRMGRMDGIFVAFHNTERIFGFQYISLPEMDFALHGQEDLTVGDSEFKLSLELLNRVLDRATAKFPEQSLRLFFETRETATVPFMYIFAEPITEEDIQKIQDSKKAEIEEYERNVLGIQQDQIPEDMKDEEEKPNWEELQAKVEEAMDDDELEVVDEGGNLVQQGLTEHADDLSSPLVSPEEPRRNREEEVINSEDNEDLDHEPVNFDARETENDMQSLEYEAEENHWKHEFDANGAALEVQSRPEDLNDLESVPDLSKGQQGHAAAVENKAGSEDIHDLSADQTLPKPSEGLAEIVHEKKVKDTRKRRSKEILAMTLTIRNKMNDVYVSRPENIGPDDRWSVEYALAEVPEQGRSRTLYEKTKRRRQQVLKKDKHDDESHFNRSYTRRLRELSQKGRVWREEQNEIDLTEPVKVLKVLAKEGE